jgi:hypothetical protein
MKGRLFLLRSAAFFLMLIFFQKAGAGLLYHSLFHSDPATELPAGSDKTISYSCACIDDYLVPFEGAEQTHLPVPVVKFILITESFEESLSFHTPVFSPLRGPPSSINV